MPAKTNKKKYKNITLILAGGGLKAISYIGFLDVLKEKGLYEKVNLIGSHSGGAFVSSMYSTGRDYDYIQKKFGDINIRNLIDLSILRKGSLLSESKINENIFSEFAGIKFSNLNKKNVIFATNLSKKRVEHFHEGYIKDYVRASMALVPLIPSVWINGDEYIDAAFMTFFPVQTLKKFEKDNLVVGVMPKTGFQVLPEQIAKRARYMELILEHAVDIMTQLDPPGIVIETLEKDRSHIFDVSHMDYYYEQGYQQGMKYYELIEDRME